MFLTDIPKQPVHSLVQRDQSVGRARIESGPGDRRHLQSDQELYQGQNCFGKR
jgi:hypothetical protein